VIARSIRCGNLICRMISPTAERAALRASGGSAGDGSDRATTGFALGGVDDSFGGSCTTSTVWGGESCRTWTVGGGSVSCLACAGTGDGAFLVAWIDGGGDSPNWTGVGGGASLRAWTGGGGGGTCLTIAGDGAADTSFDVAGALAAVPAGCDPGPPVPRIIRPAAANATTTTRHAAMTFSLPSLTNERDRRRGAGDGGGPGASCVHPAWSARSWMAAICSSSRSAARSWRSAPDERRTSCSLWAAAATSPALSLPRSRISLARRARFSLSSFIPSGTLGCTNDQGAGDPDRLGCRHAGRVINRSTALRQIPPWASTQIEGAEHANQCSMDPDPSETCPVAT